jgi:transcriptional regulator with XRE-family HTH domain
MSEEEKKIGSKIKRLRESQGIRQIDLARILGFKSATAIAFIESGRNEISVSMIVPLCCYFGITPNDLFQCAPPKKFDEIKIKILIKELSNAIK